MSRPFSHHAAIMVLFALMSGLPSALPSRSFKPSAHPASRLAG